MITTAFEVYAYVVLLYKVNIFYSRTFLIKIYDILKNNNLTCSCWASVESCLLWRYASRSNLLYSGFRYTIEIPLQPTKSSCIPFGCNGKHFFYLSLPTSILAWCLIVSVRDLCLLSYFEKESSRHSTNAHCRQSR